MYAFLLIWVILAGIAEHVLALTPSTIPKGWKRILYYLIVAPEIGLSSLKNLLGRVAGFQLLYIASWFRE